ncbi:hypothetical protein Tco_0064828 [Tanacetum coccineum]
MDAMTTRMCNQGVGRIGYARILVEVNANKELVDSIDVLYKTNDGKQSMKSVRFEYDWKPPLCKHGHVFSHSDRKCNKKERVCDEVNKKNMMEQIKDDFIQNLDDEIEQDKIRSVDREKVDKYVKIKKQPTVQESSKWTREMIKYFEDSWERCNEKKMNMDSNESDIQLEENDVCASEQVLDMIDFQNCVNDIEMEDICKFGLHFTWTKSLINPNATILKKIYRIMGNDIFVDEYNNANVVFLPYGIFDHSPALLVCPLALKKKKNKSFRFANYIADKENFKEIVRENWNADIVGHSMVRLIKKQKVMNWKNDNLFDKVVAMKNKVNSIQTLIDVDPTNKELRPAEIRVLNEYKSVVEDEEELLAQKAKVNWLKKGDRNSAYLHKGFLGISPIVPKIEVEDGLIFSKTVSEEDVVSMIEEFYKKTWDIIKKDFCEAIKEFFTIGKMLGKMNASLVDLVLKLNTHLKIVDENQSAFIPGRGITDNILLIQELLKGYNCANGPKRRALKIDLQKAYDTIIMAILKRVEASLDKETKGEIQSTMPFKIGKLLVKYLRVPLVSEKIGVADYKSLINKFIGDLYSFSQNQLSMILKDSSRSFYRALVKAVRGGQSKKEIYYAGFSDNATMADLLDENGWKWPPNCSDGKEGAFSTNRMWKDVRGMNTKVSRGNKYSYMVMPLMDVGLVDVM